MKVYFKYLVLAILLGSLGQSCVNTEQQTNTIKLDPGDPFLETMIPSQFFNIDPKKDNVIEGENGTIIIIPEGCIKYADGRLVESEIEIELAEALSLDQMILSNLTTTSNGKLLETDGMIYFNVSQNGEQLYIDPENPVYIEIPTPERKADMMVYEVVRDEMGNMNWVNPTELEQFLVPIDMELLDFYPDGFEEKVIAQLPYKGHEVISKELTDSLYYSLSVSDGSELLEGITDLDISEPMYEADTISEPTESGDTDLKDEIDPNFGIDPAIIKAIRSEQFENTLIATREFEARLQAIFKTCRNDIIEIYIRNLDKDLWELDSLAWSTLGEHQQSQAFYNFFQQKLTNVQGAGSKAELLSEYYAQRLEEIRVKLEAVQQKALKELEEKNRVAEKVAEEYKGLLNKRESYRMERYGFSRSETGWLNIDRGTREKDWASQRLEMIVENADDFEQINTYVIYTKLQSLYRLNTQNGELFYVGKEEDRKMNMPKKSAAVAIAIAFQKNEVFLAMQEFTTAPETILDLKLKPSSKEELATAIAPFDDFSDENSISRDLDYMKFFDKERQRQDQLRSEAEFLESLWRISHPCVSIENQVSEEEVLPGEV